MADEPIMNVWEQETIVGGTHTSTATPLATVASAASAAAHAASKVASAIRPPSVLHSRNPLVDAIIWLLLLEIGALVFLALPGMVPGRARIVDAVAHGPAFARVRWVYATVLSLLVYLGYDTLRKKQTADRAVEEMLKEQPRLQTFHDTFSRSARLQSDILFIGSTLGCFFLMFLMHFQILSNKPPRPATVQTHDEQQHARVVQEGGETRAVLDRDGKPELVGGEVVGEEGMRRRATAVGA